MRNPDDSESRKLAEEARGREAAEAARLAREEDERSHLIADLVSALDLEPGPDQESSLRSVNERAGRHDSFSGPRDPNAVIWCVANAAYHATMLAADRPEPRFAGSFVFSSTRNLLEEAIKEASTCRPGESEECAVLRDSLRGLAVCGDPMDISTTQTERGLDHATLPAVLEDFEDKWDTFGARHGEDRISMAKDALEILTDMARTLQSAHPVSDTASGKSMAGASHQTVSDAFQESFSRYLSIESFF